MFIIDLSFHSTAPILESGKTLISGLPTSSSCVTSPQQRESTDPALLSPITKKLRGGSTISSKGSTKSAKGSPGRGGGVRGGLDVG